MEPSLFDSKLPDAPINFLSKELSQGNIFSNDPFLIKKKIFFCFNQGVRWQDNNLEKGYWET